MAWTPPDTLIQIKIAESGSRDLALAPIIPLAADGY
jgi:hypothetical protein